MIILKFLYSYYYVRPGTTRKGYRLFSSCMPRFWRVIFLVFPMRNLIVWLPEAWVGRKAYFTAHDVSLGDRAWAQGGCRTRSSVEASERGEAVILGSNIFGDVNAVLKKSKFWRPWREIEDVWWPTTTETFEFSIHLLPSRDFKLEARGLLPKWIYITEHSHICSHRNWFPHNQLSFCCRLHKLQFFLQSFLLHARTSNSRGFPFFSTYRITSLWN